MRALLNRLGRLDPLHGALGPIVVTHQRGIVVLSGLAGATVVVGVVLFALAQSLRLGGGLGVEDWLGWSRPDQLAIAAQGWHGTALSRLPAAAAYLLIDIVLFMPLYGMCLLLGTRLLLRGLHRQPVPLARVCIVAVRWCTPLALLALWTVDAIENLGGLLRLGAGPAWASGVLATALAALQWGLLRRIVRAPSAPRGSLRAALSGVPTAGLALLCLAAMAWTGGAQPLADAARGRVIDLAACLHGIKFGVLALALLPMALAAVIRWFGLDLDSRPWAPPGPATQLQLEHRRLAEFRAACRQGAGGVVARSRYVLAMLVLFALFTLVSEQCRDLMLAMAAFDPDEASLADGAWWLLVLVVTALSLGLFALSCWLWTRQVCRVQSIGAVSRSDPVAQWIGAWARAWARALMLAPLVMNAVLLAYVAGDAVVAVALIAPASDAPLPRVGWQLFRTLAVLSAFAALLVGVALVLMAWRRRRALPRASDYYNSEPQAAALIWATPMAVWLPLAGLALLLVLRLAMAAMPQTAAVAPPTLALLACAAIWWLGPLGVIGIQEHRTLFPWALLVFGAVVLLAGASDNHLLPSFVGDDASQVRQALGEFRRDAARGIVLLSAVSAAGWFLMVVPSRRLAARAAGAVAPVRWRHRGDLRRVAFAGVLYLSLCAWLWWLDRAAYPAPDGPAEAAQAVWRPAKLATDKPMLIVAAEGGGARAAYWTARVLAQLQDSQPGWMERVAAMSGVSGGSMGLAVWRACVDAAPEPTVACVERVFRRIDLLSPLVAGLLFDDVWMRLVPTNGLCARAGCGMRSRALGFEREWMRVLPQLGVRADAWKPGRPLLLFNSTVVENGNRTVIANAALQSQTLTGAHDLGPTLRAGKPVALVTAAHTSARFPFINPLASLPGQKLADGQHRGRWHLADGGYHDNTGTATLADLLPQLREAAGGRKLQLVLIRNGQMAPPRDDTPRPDEDVARLIAPRDASRLNLYADLFGPAVALYNVAGTGAHGRAPLAALARELRQQWPATDRQAAPVCLFDQVDDGGLVPLGWSLSRWARDAMDRRAKAHVRECVLPLSDAP